MSEQSPLDTRHRWPALTRVLDWLLHPGSRLSQRVIHASLWAFGLRIVEKLFGLVRTVVLARLLAPDSFGLFGIALLALSTLETLSQTGFGAALIQKEGDATPYFDTVWTVQVIRGLALASVLLVAAPYVAKFFGEPAATALVRALALSQAVRGFTSIRAIYFRKELSFHKEFAYMASGTLADLAVAIPAALLLRNAWALILGLTAGSLVRVVASHLIQPCRSRLRIQLRQAKELYGFGRWVFGGTLIMFVAVRGVDAFVGKFIGAAALGFYQMASRIPQLVTEEAALVVSAVTFPAYARLQLSPPALKKVFFQILMAIVSFCLPLGLGMAILAPDIVQLLLGTAWMPAVTALRLLSLAGLIVAVLESGGALFVGAGYPNVGFWMHATRLLVTAATIYPLTVSYGMTGAALAALLGTVGALPVWWRGITAVVGTPDTQSVHNLSVSFAAAGIMSLGVAYGRFLVPHGGVTAVALAVSIGALLYVGVQLLAWTKWRCGVWRLVKDVRAAMLPKGGMKNEEEPHRLSS